MNHIVIGVEGTVGAGKTSICRELLNEVENSIIIHGGEIYRGIVYGILKSNIQISPNMDSYEIMKKIGIEVKLENRETKIYLKGQKISENDLQSKQSSMAVSKISGIADNKKLYYFGKDLIDMFREKYNIILSSRDIVKMYPDVTYHFFVDANIDERVVRKCSQYNGKYSKDEMKQMIIERDNLQEKSGYYKKYENTKVIDVTNCKSPKDGAKLIIDIIKEK